METLFSPTQTICGSKGGVKRNPLIHQSEETSVDEGKSSNTTHFLPLIWKDGSVDPLSAVKKRKWVLLLHEIPWEMEWAEIYSNEEHFIKLHLGVAPSFPGQTEAKKRCLGYLAVARRHSYRSSRSLVCGAHMKAGRNKSRERSRGGWVCSAHSNQLLFLKRTTARGLSLSQNKKTGHTHKPYFSLSFSQIK